MFCSNLYANSYFMLNINKMLKHFFFKLAEIKIQKSTEDTHFYFQHNSCMPYLMEKCMTNKYVY